MVSQNVKIVHMARIPDKTDRVFQSTNLEQAFFHLHWVHHWSLFSIPYTFRHFRTSLRGFLWNPVVLGETEYR